MPGKRRAQAGAPMAAEDRLLLLQSQALAEEEVTKTKREMLTRFLKDKLAKEKRSSTLNLHKLNTQWRAVLRETKDKELRQDIEILSQTFARVMDCKDSVIESLATDLEEAEEQHAQALRSHLHNVDRLLQLQRCRLMCLEEGYGAQLEALKTEFESERRTILEQHEQESHYLQDVVLAAEQSYAQSNHETTLNFQSAWDDIKNKSLQEKQYSRTQLGGKVEVLWEQFQRTMQSYTEATEHQIAFEALKQKVEKNSKDIEINAKKLQKLQDLVTATKSQITAHLRESEEQNQCMREKKERLLRQLQELRSEMNQARAKAHGSLAGLTMQSSATLKTLARVVEKGQRILRLAEMCRRLETEEEKMGSSKRPNESSRRCLWSPWPRPCRNMWGWSGSGSGSTRRSWRCRRWSGSRRPSAGGMGICGSCSGSTWRGSLSARRCLASPTHSSPSRTRTASPGTCPAPREAVHPDGLLRGGTANRIPSTVLLAPVENAPPADQGTLPRAWGHHRDCDCLEEPLKS